MQFFRNLSAKKKLVYLIIRPLRNNCTIILLLGIVLSTGCQKELDTQPQTDQKINKTWYNVTIPEHFFKEYKVPGIAENNATSSANQNLSQFTTSNPDNGDLPVVLGRPLRNPYTVDNMKQACLRLYGSDEIIYTTHLYVRFKPADTDQLSELLKDDTLELQDYPMDYEVLEEGNYYQDPSLGTEEIGWLYTTVPPNYSAPAGIEYEVLAELYIPPDDNLLLESMAESIAGGASYEDEVMNEYRYIQRTDSIAELLIVPNRFPVPCELDPCHSGCVIPVPGPDCGVFPSGSGGTSGPYYDPRVPRGLITVQDQRTCNGTTPLVPMAVRQARIVCKRWFKIWRGYTNDNGAFVSSKKFKHKVKVSVKTYNSHATISKIRGIRLWQMLFPITKQIGVYNQGAMANINYPFNKPNPTGGSDANLAYWVGFTAHNSVIEQREYAVQDGISTPPEHLHIFITNWNVPNFRGTASTPLWNKCPIFASELSTAQAFIEYFVAQPSFIIVPMGNLVDILKNQMDMAISYLASNGEYSCRLTSATIKATVYHETSHASHYAQAGCNYWYTYRTRIAQEISNLTSGQNPPYGNGDESNAGVVALGEMWGYTMECIYTDRHYGNGGFNGPAANGGFTATLQREWTNDTNPGGLNAYLRALENFDPNLLSDPDRWIPIGIPYDLMDPVGEALPVADNVNGYTIFQCFHALQPDVRTVTAFRDRLLQQNGNNQNTEVNDLFNLYHY